MQVVGGATSKRSCDIMFDLLCDTAIGRNAIEGSLIQSIAKYASGTSSRSQAMSDDSSDRSSSHMHDDAAALLCWWTGALPAHVPLFKFCCMLLSL